jgi:cell division protein FtsA
MGTKNSIVVGLDIGTAKVCAVIGEMTERGVEIIGIGTHPSQGLRKGVVINIEATVQSLNKAIEEAGLMAGCEIHTVFASISGGHIKAFNSHGIVALKNKEVGATRSRNGSSMRPRRWRYRWTVKCSMSYRRITSSTIKTASKSPSACLASASKRRSCSHRRGDLGSEHCQMLQSHRLSVAEIVLAPLAAAETVLSDEERGSACSRSIWAVAPDIGGFMTARSNTPRCSASAAITSPTISPPVCARRSTTPSGSSSAMAAPRQHGCWMNGPKFRTSPAGRGTVSRQILCEIIEPRLDEIFELVQKEVAKSGYEGDLASGVVVTGGAMLLPGAVEMAERAFGLPVRLGAPSHVLGLLDVIDSPIYTVGVGLVLHGMKRQERGAFRVRDDKILSKVKHRMSDWLSEFF